MGVFRNYTRQRTTSRISPQLLCTINEPSSWLGEESAGHKKTLKTAQQPFTTIRTPQHIISSFTMAMTPSSPSCGGFEYHDFSKESPSESLTLLSKDKTGSESNFPVKLHYMLSDMEGDGLDHIVSWQPHGRSFTVNKPKEFVEKILPL